MFASIAGKISIVTEPGDSCVSHSRWKESILRAASKTATNSADFTEMFRVICQIRGCFCIFPNSYTRETEALLRVRVLRTTSGLIIVDLERQSGNAIEVRHLRIIRQNLNWTEHFEPVLIRSEGR